MGVAMQTFIPEAFRVYCEAARDLDSRMQNPEYQQPGVFVALLEEGDFDLAPVVDSGDISCGHPYIEKFFRSLRFVGKGTLFVRVFVDDAEVAKGHVELTEDHTAPRYFNLPRGLAGMRIRVLWSGTGHTLQYYDVEWDFVSPQGGE